MPIYATPSARRSVQPPGCRALNTPSVMPVNAAKSIAAAASWSVLGKRSRMSRVIGRSDVQQQERNDQHSEERRDCEQETTNDETTHGSRLMPTSSQRWPL